MIKTYAIIEGGAVANMALAAEALEPNWVLATTGVAIGWLHDGTAFSPPQPPAPQPDPVPHSCTRRQGQRALLEVGKLDAVEAAIAAIPDALQKRIAQVEYEAGTWERNNPFLISMWSQLGGSDSELDGLFRMAQTF